MNDHIHEERSDKLSETIIKEILKEIPIIKNVINILESIELGEKDERNEKYIKTILDQTDEILKLAGKFDNQQKQISDVISWLSNTINLIKKIPNEDLLLITDVTPRQFSLFENLVYIATLKGELSNELTNLRDFQLMYDESEKYASKITTYDIDAILKNIPSSVHTPILLHNLIDILIEAQGHYRLLDPFRNDVIRALRLAEKAILHEPDILRLQIYELLGCLSLMLGYTEFYEKYLLLVKQIGLNQIPSEGYRKTTWWADSYYGDKKTAFDEHKKVISNPNYELTKTHVALLLSKLSLFRFNKYLKKQI